MIKILVAIFLRWYSPIPWVLSFFISLGFAIKEFGKIMKECIEIMFDKEI